MRICASLGSAADVDHPDLAKADMIEIRTDVFSGIPKDILRTGQTGLISFKKDDVCAVPEGWIADIGGSGRKGMIGPTVSSYHDLERTPCAAEIACILNKMDGDIVKGAFTVNSLKDNAELMDASRTVRKKHVIIGMGELGKVTRIRQRLLGNEFTFAYAGSGTAPGQLSVAEMRDLGDDCVITGIIGRGIGYTRSPAMHGAAFSHSGIRGKYLVFDTPSLDRLRDVLIGYDIRGVNVTKPYKEAVIDHLDRCDSVSEEIGAVNTVVNEKGELKGYNTDIFGIEMALKLNSVSVKGKRALILGSGGAARSCACFLSRNGCDTTITGRNAGTVKRVAKDFSLTARDRMSVAVKGYDIIVNCIPLNINNDRSEYPINIDQIDTGQTVFDMVYGRTHLTDTAKDRGCVIIKGEEMLAYQGMRSFELFVSEKVRYEVMRDAV